LLWAFECRATASRIFQLAVERSIYRDNVFRYPWQSLYRKISFEVAYNFLGLKYMYFMCIYKIASPVRHCLFKLHIVTLVQTIKIFFVKTKC
jgi:hypothetical protein